MFGRETLSDGTTRDWPLPDLLAEQPKYDTQRGSTTVPISQDFNATQLEVHFVADEHPALEMLQLDEAWDGELIIRNVSVRRGHSHE